MNRDMRGISLFRSRSRPKKDLSPGYISILLLILLWIHPGPSATSLPSQSCFYPDSTQVLVLILSISLSHSYRRSIPVPMLSRLSPGPDAVLVLFSLRPKRKLGVGADLGCTLTTQIEWYGRIRPFTTSKRSVLRP